MKKSIVSKLAVVCLTAVVAIGGVSMPASAKYDERCSQKADQKGRQTI